MSEVVITGAEYREYQELCAGRDRTVASMQAQLKIQNDVAIRQAAKFARMVVKMIEENFDVEHLRKAEKCSIVSVYDAANEIIAQE